MCYAHVHKKTVRRNSSNNPIEFQPVRSSQPISLSSCVRKGRKMVVLTEAHTTTLKRKTKTHKNWIRTITLVTVQNDIHDELGFDFSFSYFDFGIEWWAGKNASYGVEPLQCISVSFWGKSNLVCRINNSYRSFLVVIPPNNNIIQLHRA